MASSIRYEGSAAMVGLLAQMLADEGVESSYEQPVEERSADQVVAGITIWLTGQVAGVVLRPKIERVVDKFQQRSPNATLKVTIEDTPQSDEPR